VCKLKQVINLSIVFVVMSLSYVASAASNDPTKPFGQSDVSSNGAGGELLKNKLVLQSIVHGDGIHTAVINGKVIKPGERIGEYRLIAINDASVVLRNDDERLKLHIFKRSVLK
jgi:MSHA biogenesis protein MshK